VSFEAILLLSLGLAMDATAVAAARGFAAAQVRVRDVCVLAALFGGFQALMPALGFFVGNAFGRAVQAWDHWIAFVLLAAIGGKMLWEAFFAKPDIEANVDTSKNVFGIRVLVVLAIATSIDALAAGLTLPILNAPLALSLLTIGVTTTVLSAVGVCVGRRLGSLVGKQLEIFGGLVLVGLGFKILLEHLQHA
jgi:putative Mn2+ efflux pump MntP